MNGITGILRELAGLFVDDGALALSIVGVVAAAAILAALIPGKLAAGAMLVMGCAAVLLANVIVTARR